MTGSTPRDCFTLAPWLQRTEFQHNSLQHTKVMSERKWAETGERVCDLQCLRVFAQESNLSSMGAHSLGRVRSEGIKVRPNGQTIKLIVLDVTYHQVTTPNVLALTV